MDAHLINHKAQKAPFINNKPQCFFAKKMTYLESHDFSQNETHLASCEDCRLQLEKYKVLKEEISKDFSRYHAEEEVKKSLEAELIEIIPTLEEDKSELSLPKKPYSLSLKSFALYLLFGIPRKAQYLIIGGLILAACIY